MCVFAIAHRFCTGFVTSMFDEYFYGGPEDEAILPHFYLFIFFTISLFLNSGTMSTAMHTEELL